MNIIPAIDIIDGKCVRLTKGDYTTRKIYNEDPVAVAKMLEGHGIRHLHLVDLDGARCQRIINFGVLTAIASKTSLAIDFGGGVRSTADLMLAFDSGAKQVTVGSIAAAHSDLFLQWLDRYGADKIILGADCNNRKIAVNGWMEESDNDILAFIQAYETKGVRHCIVTDIARDGMLSGPATDLYQEIKNSCNVNLIASGGISSIDDLHALSRCGCSGAIIGKAIYEGYITLKELSQLC